MNNIEKMIRILKFEPQKLPYEKEIVNNLEGIQGEVKGFFECIYLDNNCVLVYSEEGKLNGRERNRRVGNDVIAGPFFIVRDNENGGFVSLSDDQIKCYTKEFGEIQEFT